MWKKNGWKVRRLLEKVVGWFRKKPVAEPPPKVVPILEKHASRPSPEYSGLNEDLYVLGMTAEDGCLWIFRDYAQPGKPVVEVRVDDDIIDLRRNPLNSFHIPPGEVKPRGVGYAHARVMEWLHRHDRRDETHDPRFGYQILRFPGPTF